MRYHRIPFSHRELDSKWSRRVISNVGEGLSEPLEELLAAASRAFLRKEVEIIVNLDYSAIIHEVLRSVCPGITEQW